MKDSKSITMLKRKRTIITVVIVTVLCSLVAIWFYVNNYSKRYNKPSFETMYTEGKVEVDDQYGYSEMKVAEEYILGACGNPNANEDGVDLFFSNPEENDVYLKCLLLNEDNEVIGESGLIKPNSYIKTIKFKKAQPPGDYELTIKVLGFEPDTYYSKGVVYLKTYVNIE